jgi:hypothetical protein
MTSVIPDEVWALIFLMASTVFLWLGHSKNILLLELIAFLMLFAGAVWAILTPLPWFIPVLFILANAAIFVLDVVRK